MWWRLAFSLSMHAFSWRELPQPPKSRSKIQGFLTCPVAMPAASSGSPKKARPASPKKKKTATSTKKPEALKSKEREPEERKETEPEECTETEPEERKETEPQEVLTVRLLGGKDLPSADRNGTSDPYVKLSVGGKTKKSEVVKKTLNPTWDQSFSFKGSELQSSKLELTCMDWDKKGKHDKLGRAELPLEGRPAGVQVVELSGGGTLTLVLKWSEPAAAPSSAAPVPAGTERLAVEVESSPVEGTGSTAQAAAKRATPATKKTPLKRKP